MAVHIGTSGWSYPHWTSVLYPPGLPATGRLDVYLQRFGSAELNASYYQWPTDRAFERWHRRMPAAFTLSVKAPGALTHRRRLHRNPSWQQESVFSLLERHGAAYDDDLRWWAARIREWQVSGRDVYAYFNNDGDGHAVRNAATLQQFLHQGGT